jgi:hypothetical protein
MVGKKEGAAPRRYQDTPAERRLKLAVVGVEPKRQHRGGQPDNKSANATSSARGVPLLMRTHVDEAHRAGATKVIRFVSASGDYAKLLRKAPWSAAGIDATLATIDWHADGAQIEVPRRLVQAFSAWRYRSAADYPTETIAEPLR